MRVMTHFRRVIRLNSCFDANSKSLLKNTDLHFQRVASLPPLKLKIKYQMISRDIAPIYSSFASHPDFAELVAEYVNDLPARVETCVGFIESQNWPDLMRFAHQVKGSAGSYGFGQITAIAALLEAALARETELELRTKLAEDLIAHMSAIRV